MSKILELATRFVEIANKTTGKINSTATFLASLPRKERLDWLKKHRHSCPASFEREIGGTIYTVNAHFSSKTAETVKEQVERILNQNITH